MSAANTNPSRVETAVGAHLVGGLKAPSAESAMRTALRILGRHVRAVPDGETGDRSRWIGWQRHRLTSIEGIAVAGTHDSDAENPEYTAWTALAISPSLTALPPRVLGYADAAAESYGVFRRLRAEGVVPDGVKFQVSVPTPFATVITWARVEDQQRFLPIYADALAEEVRGIVGAVGEDLLLQYDVAVELAAITQNTPAAEELTEEAVVIESLKTALARTPEGVQYGIHLCYGDYNHQHFAVPQDLSLCVKIANAVGDGAAYVHMPADRGTGRDPAYFEPLRDLSAEHLALGVIDYEGDQQRTAELIQAAITGSGGMEFAVATECGMARIDERGPGGPSLEHLLELHAENSASLSGR
jgi:methionine synthase II (cobalamin-independent)